MHYSHEVRLTTQNQLKEIICVPEKPIIYLNSKYNFLNKGSQNFLEPCKLLKYKTYPKSWNENANLKPLQYSCILAISLSHSMKLYLKETYV